MKKEKTIYSALKICMVLLVIKLIISIPIILIYSNSNDHIIDILHEAMPAVIVSLIYLLNKKRLKDKIN